MDPVELFHNVKKMLTERNVYANVDLKENWFFFVFEYITTQVKNTLILQQTDANVGLTRLKQKG